MQTVSCPSCGAEVKFRSHASVMAVCEYCGTGVLKDADGVKDLGRMSSVLEDYTRVQIGTSGLLGGRPFTVVGRLQLRYPAGMWNEWHLLFDDGASGWLGDASGQYMVTAERPLSGPLPAFEQLAPGGNVVLDGLIYTAADVRVAQCVGGQGELPFKVGAGYQTRSADLRSGGQFLTLDYADDGPPKAYSGSAVTLEALQCQLLRDDDAIQRSAGRYRGKLTALDCPSCGGAIRYLPGMTAHLLCPSCGAQLDAASPKVEVLRAGERVAALRTSLELGAQSTLNAEQYTVIGVMRRADDEGTQWTEYLLYGVRAGFTWLVETDEGWSRSSVLDMWPLSQGPGAPVVQLGPASFRKLYDYQARVTFAAGAFNWQVAVGDTVQVSEYENGQARLAAEGTAEELTWSRSAPVPFDQMQAWFGDKFSGEAPPPRKLAQDGRYKRTAKTIMMVMLAFNAIPLLANFQGTWFLSAIGALAIYLPALFLDTNDDKS
jgi:predicted RNA-binding Zn-ribbon protein involved in translation (DUF1610 family)